MKYKLKDKYIYFVVITFAFKNNSNEDVFRPTISLNNHFSSLGQ